MTSEGPSVPLAAEDVRTLLHAQLEDNAEQLRALEREHGRVVSAADAANGDDEHDPEGATIAFEREQLTALLRQARETEAEVRAALRRLDDGTYGVCAGCGGAIAPARLEARPTARTCIECAARSSRT